MLYEVITELQASCFQLQTIISLKKYHVIIPEAISLRSVPARNPINEPKPDFKASLCSFPAVSSPITAPKNGPIIIPKGGKKKSPITKPIRNNFV